MEPRHHMMAAKFRPRHCSRLVSLQDIQTSQKSQARHRKVCGFFFVENFLARLLTLPEVWIIILKLIEHMTPSQSGRKWVY